MRILLLLCLALSSPLGLAAYDYPYKDPLYATLSTGLLKADERDKERAPENWKLQVLSERSKVPLVGARNFVQLRFWRGQANAPLVFMIAGLGGSGESSNLDFLAYQFNKKGFHVITLPSAYHWTFALTASQSGYPGASMDDAKDTYRLVQLAVAQMKENNISFGSTALLGISMGALQAAFLSTLDQKEQRIGFKKTLLINPPVNIFYGIDRLDSFFSERKDLSKEERKSLNTKTTTFFGKSLLRDMKEPDYFLKLSEQLPLNDREKKIIIGQTMREFLGALVFTTQQINDRGVLHGPVAISNPDPRLEEAGSWSMRDYIQKLLLPVQSEILGRNQTEEEMAKSSSFLSIENEIKANGNIFLMHNEDDFLIETKQIQYLQNLFGTRMRLYPHGGHLGNLWYPENLDAILGTFEGI